MGALRDQWFRAFLFLVIASGVGGGCGGGASPLLAGKTPSIVQAPAATAPQYHTRNSDGVVVGSSPAAEAIERGVARAGRGAIVGDGRLGLLASWVAEILGEGATPPPHEVVEFFAHHLGIVEPTPHLLILGQPDAAALEDAVERSVSQFLSRQPYSRYGGTVVQRDGIALVVIVLTGRWIELEPLPRRVLPGSAIALRGRLLEGYSRPTLLVAKPNGEFVRSAGGSGPSFSFDVPTAEEGTYGVELLAEGPRGITVVANFPVYVGVPIPDRIAFDGATEGGDESRGDPGEVARALLSQINRTRAEAGVPALLPHPELTEIALAHSRDMLENGFVGHTSPRTGTAPERVERAGIRTGLVLENIGRGYGAGEIHRGLLQSPGHRANLLNPDVTHVGIGVVAEREGTRTAYLATQVFVRMGREIDVGAAPDRLFRAIQEGRSARGAPPVEVDPNLAKAAQDAAKRYFAEPRLRQQDAVDDATGSLRRFGIAFRRVGGVMVVVTTLEEAMRLEPTFDPEVRYVGIGVAQGVRPDSAPNAIAVVILLAWPR